VLRMRDEARRALDGVGLGRPARWVWGRRPAAAARRRFAAWLEEADRRDNERMRLVIAATVNESSNCVDIGAATGDLLADIVRLAPRGHHIAYEPLPGFFAALGERFPQVDARNAAVSDTAGEADFMHVSNAPGWSGLRAYDIQVEARLETITVPSVRLDDDLPAGYVPTLIKIDVNGAEALTVRGAERTIATHRPVVLFEHGQAAAAYGTTPNAMFDLLSRRCGLRIFDLQGQGPFDAEEFTLATRTRWNFMARP